MRSNHIGLKGSNWIQHIKKQGVLHTARSILWKFKQYLYKRYILLQDQHGWYTYADWLRNNKANPVSIPATSSRNSFSFLVLESSGSLQLIKDTLDSIHAQSHLLWTASIIIEDPDLLQNLKSSYQNESHFLWMHAPGLSNWKEAVEKSTGDWIVCLNSGDTLPPNALATVASWMDAYPSATIFYSDYDRLSLDGLRYHSPSFWPDWSPELILSVNYLPRAFFSRSGLIAGSANSVDFEDALLRCTESAQQIIHIPKVLFHLRDGQKHPWIGDYFSSENLITHLQRSGLNNITTQSLPDVESLKFSWPINDPFVSIVILTHDQVELLKRCLDTLLALTNYHQFEIILVENNSQEPATFSYYDQLRQVPQIKIVEHNQPFNYSASNNWGVQHANGELICFLNNDVEIIDAGWLEEMTRWACKPDIGVVGAKLLYPNGLIQHAGLVIGLGGHANHLFAGCESTYSGIFGSVDWYRDFSAVTGACMMLRRTVFDQIGGFDENYSLAFNDIELCLRVIKAGYRVMYTPFAKLIHHEGSTRGKSTPSSDIQLAYDHFKTQIERGDPFYNPNLSYTVRIPTLRRPGEIAPIKRLEHIVEYSN